MQQLFATNAPMPAKPRVKIDLVGDDLTLEWRKSSWGVTLFLCLWMTIWTAGCVAMLNKLLTEFEWFMMLFATPFFAAWVVVAGLLLVLLFGRQRIVLSREEVTVTSKAIITYSTRMVPLDEVGQAASEEVWSDNDDGPPTSTGIVEISTLGHPVQFASGIKESEAEWLAETINVCLDQLAPHRSARTLADQPDSEQDNAPNDDLDETTSEDLDDDTLDDDMFVFDPPRERHLEPSDSTWVLSRQGRAVEFTNRGHWSLSDIGGTLFINLFWNGIVGVFIVQLVQEFQWFLALFLIPFVVIGLLMLLALLSTLTAPAWGERYSIRFGRIEHRKWGPLFGHTKVHDFERLARIEISDPGFEKQLNSLRPGPSHFSEGEYQIALIDADGTETATIESLTKGEALWMADTIMAEHPEMFDRDR